MITNAEARVSDRLGGAGATLLIHLALGLALLWGLDAPLPQMLRDPLAVFEIAPPPPPPEPPRPPPRRVDAANTRRAAPGREGAASPPNLRSEATPVVAPVPLVQLPIPTPIVAAPIAGRGADPSSGAAEIPGPGTGAGGFGDGSGSGYGGDGGGGGGGFAPETPPRLLRGRISDRDFPRWADEQGIAGAVGVRFTVAIDGRATRCRITRSSGSAQLDAFTCGLLERRYRFAPSRDRRGEPVSADIIETHSWAIVDPPEEDEDY